MRIKLTVELCTFGLRDCERYALYKDSKFIEIEKFINFKTK